MLIKGTTTDNFLIVLHRGDKLVESLTQIATEAGIKGGMISAVGALKDVELGYYELAHKTYLRKTFQDEDYELIHLSGNISLKDNAPYIHVHTVLGRSDFSTFGGHLFEATVAVTAEIYITPLGKLPTRKMNDEVGLHLLCGQSS